MNKNINETDPTATIENENEIDILLVDTGKLVDAVKDGSISKEDIMSILDDDKDGWISLLELKRHRGILIAIAISSLFTLLVSRWSTVSQIIENNWIWILGMIASFGLGIFTFWLFLPSTEIESE